MVVFRLMLAMRPLVPVVPLVVLGALPVALVWVPRTRERRDNLLAALAVTTARSRTSWCRSRSQGRAKPAVKSSARERARAREKEKRRIREGLLLSLLHRRRTIFRRRPCLEAQK